ncbi:hypothetical protein HWV62_16810 [Athelia sp. TMB]|nr:hypothetical protein HWV62_16810 [Athelia sp. TMB]
MPPAKHTSEEEQAFMNDLLSGLDDSFFNAIPSPDPSPVKRRSPQKRLPMTPKKLRRKSPKKSVTANIEDIDMSALMEGAEDWNWDDMEADFLTPEKKKAPSAQRSGYMRDPCTRCIVEAIENTDGGLREKTLIVKLDPGEERRIVILRDDWIYTDVRLGDTINVIGTFVPRLPPPPRHSLTSAALPSSTISVTSSSNLLVLHPDTLLTATALSTAPTCTRRPLLNMLVHSSSDTTPSLVWGSILHEVMQHCLREGRWELDWIDNKIGQVVRGEAGGRGLADLVRLGVSVEEAIREVKARAGGLHGFGEKYIAQKPKPVAFLTDTRSTDKTQALLAITHLHDVEEDIWSPTYGIKGKLDATVQASITSPSAATPFNRAKLPSPPTNITHPTPLELKTGRPNVGMEHRAQTLLYTLLTAERYATPVPSGLLYYTQSEEVVRIPVTRNEIRGLMGGRNTLASFLTRRSKPTKDRAAGEVHVEEPFLPPALDDERICKKCFALDICMLYRKGVENVQDDSSPIADIYELKTGHLTPTHTAFFKQWEAAITLEEQDMTRFKKELWTMGAAEREKRGRCFADMVLQPSWIPPPEQAGSAAKGIHQFTYKFMRTASYGCKEDSVSLLYGHMGVGEIITVSVEPGLLALARGFILELTPQEVVVGIDHKLDLKLVSARVTALAKARGELCVATRSRDILFRIDKDEFASGMGRIRDNLAQLFYAGGDSRRLALIADLAPPAFDEQSTLPAALTSHLNSCQQSALKKILSAQDYCLVLGMPGTGKTTVIVTLIRILVGMGQTVLLASHTHSAVDNILAMMMDESFGILRLGNVDKVHPNARQFTLEGRRTPTNTEQLEHQLMTPPVVATTCLSIDNALFTRRKFDYCIIDEASQITMPTCLGPLRFAEKFVLVGDHFQLPPLPQSTLSRHLLDIKSSFGEVCKTKSLYNAAINEINSTKAVFVDTDLLPAVETRAGDLVQNPTEAALICQLTETLVKSGVPESSIGIIAVYRQQIKLLSHFLHDRKDIEILTADRSQGRDKEIILMSMVRSNDGGHSGDLVKDWRRMNVSFTRARSKLIIFGSRKTLQKVPLLSEFFALMETKGWILAMPPGASHVPLLSASQAEHNAEKRKTKDVGENEQPDRSPTSAKKSRLDAGLLKGRPILQDLVNGEA